MRSKAVARIEPPLFINRFQLRQFVAMRFDELFFVRRNVALERQRLVFWRQPIVRQDRVQLIDRHVQTAGNPWQVSFNVAAWIPHQEA